MSQIPTLRYTKLQEHPEEGEPPPGIPDREVARYPLDQAEYLPAQPVMAQPGNPSAQPVMAQPGNPPAQPVMAQPGNPPAQPVMAQPGNPPAQPVMAQPGYPPAQPRHSPAQPVMAQPAGFQQTTNTTVIVTQPTPLVLQEGMRDWSTDLCGCFEDCESFCLGCWCPCILQCVVSSRMGECCCLDSSWPGALAIALAYGLAVLAPQTVSYCLGLPQLVACLWAACTYVPPIVALRIKLRMQEKIQGSLCNDYCLVQCCGVCVLCQLARELDHIEMRRSYQNRIV